MGNFTSLQEVERISAMQEPILRNFHITQSYHELSQLMATRTGPCANWCTFATWASKQAGQTIRREDLAKALEERLSAVPEIETAISNIAKGVLLKGSHLGHQGIKKLVWEVADPNAAALRASEAVARGNRKVYAEIGWEFARFLDTCIGDTVFNPLHIADFCNSLRPGDPPDGQQYLRQAFSRYYEAFFETDPKKKAELLLWANMEIGFHEQPRLQPEIKAAMEAAVIDPKQFKATLLTTLFPRQNWMSEIGSLFSQLFHRPTPLDNAINHFTTVVRHQIRLIMSLHLMELGLPGGETLRLGKDLKTGYPELLKHLSNPGLIGWIHKIDPTPDSLQETATRDWADLQDRLHFIADLFRCYQEEIELLSPPFESDQFTSIEAGMDPGV